ncbi:E1 [Canine papillomavirus 23]|nr:E1 [Canine papillomavirus 23]
MADNDGGNDCDGDGGWFLVTQADCESSDSEEDLEKLLDGDAEETDVSDLIDDTDCGPPGNHAAVLHKQLAEEDRQRVSELKRKYTTPSPKTQDVQDLSPRLALVSLSPRKKHSKRRLFEDSGFSEHEASGVTASGQVSERQDGCSQEVQDAGSVSSVINNSQSESMRLLKFKDTFGVSVGELSRVYKSDKTCCSDWVVVVFGGKEEVLEAGKIVLQNYADFFQMQCLETCLGFMALILIQFKYSKNRETLKKLLCQHFCVAPTDIYAEPPKNRSAAVALYFYKSACNKETFKHGEYPEWLSRQLSLSHQMGAETFELCKMIQWAYDNDHVDEATIAYHYALEADNDANAAAWLKSNCQAKYVRDCCTMVRLYKRKEMRNMTMSQWVGFRCSREKQEGDWRDIAKFLKYQGVVFLDFLCTLRQVLAGTPKKCCIIIHGPPDTGKSCFAFSLISFLGGAVVTFANAKSHFWLSPLADAKIGMLDDATHLCLQYMDQNMRSSFDGNPVSMDCKHRAPVQMKMPPMILTSNINIHDDPLYFYLKSRMKGVHFPRPFPCNADGSPLFSLTPGSWKSFFEKLHEQLGLEPEDFQDGEPACTLRIAPRNSVSAL